MLARSQISWDRCSGAQQYIGVNVLPSPPAPLPWGYGVHTSRKKLDFPLFSRLSRTQALRGNAPR